MLLRLKIPLKTTMKIMFLVFLTYSIIIFHMLQELKLDGGHVRKNLDQNCISEFFQSVEQNAPFEKAQHLNFKASPTHN